MTAAEDRAHGPEESGRECEGCTYGIRPLGRLYGVNMGKGRVRLTTGKGCPEHDSCHGWTKMRRAAQPEWSNPYCPIHATRNCPEAAS